MESGRYDRTRGNGISMEFRWRFQIKIFETWTSNSKPRLASIMTSGASYSVAKSKAFTVVDRMFPSAHHRTFGSAICLDNERYELWFEIYMIEDERSLVNP